MRAANRPLSGTKVLEIGHSIAAPFAGMILADLGAEVVKLENPNKGDHTRGWGPPFARGDATAFHAVNRNKKSITVDLNSREEVARLHNCIQRDFDVVLHNLKAGAMERHGLGEQQLLADKPTLVYCNIHAFGKCGPLSHLPGYDPLMQAFSGMMSIMGEEGRAPVRVGVSIVDMATGMWAAIAILAALRQRDRHGTGHAIDTSLLETALTWMNIPFASYFENGVEPSRQGSGLQGIVPYQAFRAADDYMMIAAGNDGLFRRLCGAIDQKQLADDPAFATNAARVTNRDTLVPLLEKIFATLPRDYWLARIRQAGVPCGPIQTVQQVTSHPQVTALGIIQTAPQTGITTVGMPFSIDGVRPPLETSAPALGDYNDDYLNQNSGDRTVEARNAQHI
jgi:crotonobetainyl-CoA:carnitine CoA-transferase CaiB-like acyl-CoA transferase